MVFKSPLYSFTRTKFKWFFFVSQGIRPIVNVDSCYISDMYSFCTVLEPEEKSSAILTIANSVIYDVQVTF